MHIIRLKDKLGNRSNASSEVEFDGAYAQLVGEEGRGIPTIIEMAGYTRLDCCIGSSALMRQAVAQAIASRAPSHGVPEEADRPAADDQRAGRSGARVAKRRPRSRCAWRAPMTRATRRRTVFRRVVTPAAKFWICKRAPYRRRCEAMEVLGGSGYIEESIMPRLYREAPVNSIWEGSGNVMCLDVLRAIARTPNTADVLRARTRRRRRAAEDLRRHSLPNGSRRPSATTKRRRAR